MYVFTNVCEKDGGNVGDIHILESSSMDINFSTDLIDNNDKRIAIKICDDTHRGASVSHGDKWHGKEAIVRLTHEDLNKILKFAQEHGLVSVTICN